MSAVTLTEVAEGTWCWAVVAMHAGKRVRLKSWVDPHQYIVYVDRTYRYGNQTQYHVPTTLFDGWELYDRNDPIIVEPGSFMWAVAHAHMSPIAIKSGPSPEFKMDQGVLRLCNPSTMPPHIVMCTWSHLIGTEWEISSVYARAAPGATGGIST